MVNNIFGLLLTVRAYSDYNMVSASKQSISDELTVVVASGIDYKASLFGHRMVIIRPVSCRISRRPPAEKKFGLAAGSATGLAVTTMICMV